jgi:predicted chitinase
MVNPVVGQRYTSEETNKLVHLKEQMDYSWSQLLEHFPGRTEHSLKRKYTNTREGDHHLRLYEKDEIETILNMKDNLDFTWEKIAENFPDRKKAATATWYWRQKRKYSTLTSSQQNYSSLQAPPVPKRRKLQ